LVSYHPTSSAAADEMWAALFPQVHAAEILVEFVAREPIADLECSGVLAVGAVDGVLLE